MVQIADLGCVGVTDEATTAGEAAANCEKLHPDATVYSAMSEQEFTQIIAAFAIFVIRKLQNHMETLNAKLSVNILIKET